MLVGMSVGRDECLVGMSVGRDEALYQLYGTNPYYFRTRDILKKVFETRI
jgi:hypothetical protein